MLDGLWAGGNQAQTDFAAIAFQLKLLGFNGIRLPFIFGDLKAPIQTGFKGASAGCQQMNLNDIIKTATDPSISRPNKPGPNPTISLPNMSQGCNSYIPDSSTMDRYLWVIQWFIANGYYVLVDFHPMGLEQTSYDVNNFVNSWKWVWSTLACLPNFDDDMKGRVFLDLLNEPDSMNHRWERTHIPGEPDLLPAHTWQMFHAALWSACSSSVESTMLQ